MSYMSAGGMASGSRSVAAAVTFTAPLGGRVSSRTLHVKRPPRQALALPPVWLLPGQSHYQSPAPRSKSSSYLRYGYRTASTSSKADLSYPSHLSNPTPYDIFHFPTRTISSSEVKTRYYDLVRVSHPDRYDPDSSRKSKAQVEEEFKSVVRAYNLLKDPRSKQLYDRAGIGWSSSGNEAATGTDPWKGFQDLRYTRRYNPSFSGAGHDRFGWQHQGFYSNQYSSFKGGNAGWNGKGHYTSNGVFISTLFVVTWFLAGLQYSRLSLQSQKAVERADRSHMDAAKSLHEAREVARSIEGRERWAAFRRKVRAQRLLETEVGGHLSGEEGARVLAIEAPLGERENGYGIGHGGPSGKKAAQERFAKAQGSPSNIG